MHWIVLTKEEIAKVGRWVSENGLLLKLPNLLGNTTFALEQLTSSLMLFCMNCGDEDQGKWVQILVVVRGESCSVLGRLKKDGRRE